MTSCDEDLEPTYLVQMIRAWEQHLGVRWSRRWTGIEYVASHIRAGVRADIVLRLDGWCVVFDGLGTYLLCPSQEAARAVVTAILLWRSMP